MKVQVTYRIYNGNANLLSPRVGDVHWQQKNIIDVNKREFNALMKVLKEIKKVKIDELDEKTIKIVEKIKKTEKSPPQGWEAIGYEIAEKENKIITTSFNHSNFITILERI